MKLHELLHKLKQAGFYTDLAGHSHDEELTYERAYCLTCRTAKNRYKKCLNSTTETYFNLSIREDGTVYDIVYIINYKDENHTFLNIDFAHQILHISYAVLTENNE